MLLLRGSPRVRVAAGARARALRPLQRRLLSSTPPAGDTANTACVVEIQTAQDFETLVMQASSQQPPVGGPVILDFYADWCEPCKKLTPKLESLVAGTDGAIRLAKVNVDNHPELAQALQVKSLPTVMLVHMGKLADSFQGVLPDPQLKAFVEKAVDLVGGPTGAKAAEEAAALLESGDVAGATSTYAQLLYLPEWASTAKAGLAMCALKDDNLELAQELVAEMKKAHPGEVDKPVVRRAISAVSLAAEASSAAGGRSVSELRALLDEDPLAHATRFELAQALMARDEAASAVDELLAILKKDKAFAAQTDDGPKSARELLLQIFDALGTASDVTKKGRRRLANILLM